MDSSYEQTLYQGRREAALVFWLPSNLTQTFSSQFKRRLNHKLYWLIEVSYWLKAGTRVAAQATCLFPLNIKHAYQNAYTSEIKSSRAKEPPPRIYRAWFINSVVYFWFQHNGAPRNESFNVPLNPTDVKKRQQRSISHEYYTGEWWLWFITCRKVTVCVTSYRAFKFQHAPLS